MDPVEASFQGTPEEVRLDPSDANFVDVIHTDAAPLVPFLGEPHDALAASMCGCVLTKRALHYEKLMAVHTFQVLEQNNCWVTLTSSPTGERKCRDARRMPCHRLWTSMAFGKVKLERSEEEAAPSPEQNSKMKTHRSLQQLPRPTLFLKQYSYILFVISLLYWFWTSLKHCCGRSELCKLQRMTKSLKAITLAINW